MAQIVSNEKGFKVIHVERSTCGSSEAREMRLLHGGYGDPRRRLLHRRAE
ncbi:MAG: hypothetical protein ACLT1W_02560 [Alistipes onderdonkii]